MASSGKATGALKATIKIEESTVLNFGFMITLSLPVPPALCLEEVFGVSDARDTTRGGKTHSKSKSETTAVASGDSLSAFIAQRTAGVLDGAQRR